MIPRVEIFNLAAARLHPRAPRQGRTRIKILLWSKLIYFGVC
jgi:hypothetical protein